MSIGTFMLVRNEAPWIAAHILRVLPFIDEAVFFDGNSTDGTTEIIEAIQDGEPGGDKIRLFKNHDCKDMKDDYVRLFNDCLRALSTDLAWFLHPDQFVLNPERISQIANSDAVALSCKMRSFAGNPGEALFEMKGRGEAWKNIYRLRNPDLGAHYHGWYGAHNEDVYFKSITGDEHEHHGHNFQNYPYEVVDSGIEVLHFSDVRTYERRLGRMKTCLANQGTKPERIDALAASHPRVTLKSGSAFHDNFTLVPAEYPAEFLAAREKYAHLEKQLANV